MITSTLALSATGVALPAESAQAVAPAERVQAFQEAMGRQAEQPRGVEGVGAPGPVGPASEADIDAQSRARRGLGLDGAEAGQAATPPSPGDSILDGIQRLRGVFDAREARIADLMDGRTMDAGALMAMQMEIANFTLLVDITSKLTGKSTQALDTLMKGQ